MLFAYVISLLFDTMNLILLMIVMTYILLSADRLDDLRDGNGDVPGLQSFLSLGGH